MKQKLPPLHQICGKDKSRPDFMQIWFTKKRVYVSDCHNILMWAERKDFFEKYCFSPENAPNKFSISADIWKQLSKYSTLIFLPENNISSLRMGAGSYKLNDPNKFTMPNFDVVIPLNFRGSVARIGINPNLLAKISSVFKSDCGNGDCILNFIAENKPIGVSPTDSDCIFKAILMPILL